MGSFELMYVEELSCKCVQLPRDVACMSSSSKRGSGWLYVLEEVCASLHPPQLEAVMRGKNSLVGLFSIPIYSLANWEKMELDISKKPYF